MMHPEYKPANPSEIPMIIQGGMGVGVSNSELAKAVAAVNGLGVVSGTAIGPVLARRLQDGDPDNKILETLAKFPDQNMAENIIDNYYLPKGRCGKKYKNVAPPNVDMAPLTEQLNIVGAYAEVNIAKQLDRQGLIGVNLLTKIEPPTMSTLFGAMLAGANVVIMGAGIPSHIPEILRKLHAGEPASMRLAVSGATKEHLMTFDQNKFPKLADVYRSLPDFLAIIASNALAKRLQSKSETRPSGFVIEGPTAGGHNAPARGKTFKNNGEPFYGPKDEVDLNKIAELGLPFWLAGGYGSPKKLKEALGAGANGIQVGSAFALCEESGMAPELKTMAINRIVGNEEINIYTDPLVSPSGFPFKVADLYGTLSDSEILENRRRVCDLGYLREMYEKPDGEIGYRCPAEPKEIYLLKTTNSERTNSPISEEEALERTIGRACICNGLLSTVGMPQVRTKGIIEPAIVTLGNDVNRVVRELTGPNKNYYTAKEVISYLLS